MRFAESTLGVERTAELRKVQPQLWYPVEVILDILDERLSRYAMTQVGRTLFEVSHHEQARKVLKTGRDFVYALDRLYHTIPIAAAT